MSDNDNDELESTNQSTEEVVKTDDVEDESANDESEDIEKLRESNKRLFERTKKAEAEAKLLKAERVKKEEIAKVDAKPVEKQAEFDLEDVAVFVQKVPNKEDRELVKDYAKFKGIRLEEALEVPVIVATLKDNDEKRKSAAATILVLADEAFPNRVQSRLLKMPKLVKLWMQMNWLKLGSILNVNNTHGWACESVEKIHIK